MHTRLPVSLVTFSGPDGAGKSTQIGLLLAGLGASHRRAAVIWTRGGYTPFMRHLKTLVRRASGQCLPPAGRTAARAKAFERRWVRRVWLALALVDLLLLLGLHVRLKRRLGWVVVCDRYLDDTLIDFRLNFPRERVERWWLWRVVARLAPQPDVAFLLLLSVAESARRSDLKAEPFTDSAEARARRLAQYEALAEQGTYRVLEGSRPARELAETIAAAVGRQPAGERAYQPAA